MRYVRLIATPITLLLLVGVLAFGAWWGYKNVIAPVEPAPPPPCVPQSVGKELTSSKVTVSVYNGGPKRGLASDVAKALKAKGFIIKGYDNTDEVVKATVIVGANKNNPEVKLVLAQFKNATVREDNRADGTVDVLVGSTFGGLNDKAANKISVTTTTVCLPSPSPTPTPTPTATPTR